MRRICYEREKILVQWKKISRPATALPSSDAALGKNLIRGAMNITWTTEACILKLLQEIMGEEVGRRRFAAVFRQYKIIMLLLYDKWTVGEHKKKAVKSLRCYVIKIHISHFDKQMCNDFQLKNIKLRNSNPVNGCSHSHYHAFLSLADKGLKLSFFRNCLWKTEAELTTKMVLNRTA